MSGAEGIHADTHHADEALPDVPEKLYFTIGEVSKLCAVPAHVLRYWERKIPGLSQVSRRNNRRYYRREDVLKARQIRELIYDRGMTIQGAVQALKSPEARVEVAPMSAPGSGRGPDLQELRDALKEVSHMLSKGLGAAGSE